MFHRCCWIPCRRVSVKRRPETCWQLDCMLLACGNIVAAPIILLRSCSKIDGGAGYCLAAAANKHVHSERCGLPHPVAYALPCCKNAVLGCSMLCLAALCAVRADSALLC